MQYAPPPAAQGKSAPFGRVMLALAGVTLTKIAERESAKVAREAISVERFIWQNYRLSIE
jgi:hypothetical protein